MPVDYCLEVCRSFFYNTWTPIYVEKDRGWVELSDSHFQKCYSENSSSILYLKFNSIQFSITNVNIMSCFSQNGNHVFEIDSKTDESRIFLNRFSSCNNGIRSSAAYAHTIVCRCTTFASHVNSSKNIANRDAGFYIEHRNAPQNINYFQSCDSIAEDYSVFTVLCKEATITHLVVMNCSAESKTNKCVMCVTSGRIIYSNFLNNKGHTLLESDEIIIQSCFVDGLNSISCPKVSSKWLSSSNYIMIIKPGVFIQDNADKEKSNIIKVLLFFGFITKQL